MIATGLFFFVYDAVAHRPVPYTPMLGLAYGGMPDRNASEARTRPLDIELSSAGTVAANDNIEAPAIASHHVRAVTRAQAKLNLPDPPNTRRWRLAAPRIRPDARAAFARSSPLGYVPFGGF
jgi:hypothetical protein